MTTDTITMTTTCPTCSTELSPVDSGYHVCLGCDSIPVFEMTANGMVHNPLKRITDEGEIVDNISSESPALLDSADDDDDEGGGNTTRPSGGRKIDLARDAFY